MNGEDTVKMTVFNVDFGESIIISDCEENNNLLIDYGSETNTNINYIKNKLSSLKEDKNIEAMITHFHDDHIKGFIDLAKEEAQLFSKIYIPNIFSTYNNSDVDNVTYVEIEIILFFLLNYRFASGKLSLFEFLRAIADVEAELYILQRGDEFESAKTEYITLWPNISEIQFIKDFTKDELRQFFNVIGKELNSPIDLNAEIKEISFLLIRTFLKRSDSIVREDIKEDIKNLDKRIKILVEKARELNKKMGQKRKDELNKWIKRLKCNANKVSIVFQNKLSRIGSNILMTGDIDKCRLNWILENRVTPSIMVHSRFNIIKAPHHGTKEHFVDNLPVTKNIIISNGRTNKTKRGKVSSCYLRYQGRGALINCTNAHKSRCEIRELGQTCQGRCNLFNNKQIEIFYSNIEPFFWWHNYIEGIPELTYKQCNGRRVSSLECYICCKYNEKI